MPKPPEIPRLKLRGGAAKCLEVAASRLDEAAALIEAGFLSQATVIFSFAVEEYGKAVLLRQAYETGGDPVVVTMFYEHKEKLAAAANVIPAKHLRLTSGFFDPDWFDPCFFDTGTRLDVAARLDGLYVNWDGDWRHGVSVDVDTLRESIAGVRATLAIPMANWS